MFGKSKLDKLELQVKNLQKLNDQLIESFAKCATLIDISVDRVQRKNIFTFQKNGEVFTIKTISMMEDNVASWKQKAGIE